MLTPGTEILLLEETVWLLTRDVGIPVYDFRFRDWFSTRSPYDFPQKIKAVARVGAVPDYAEFYKHRQADGVSLINSPDEQFRASQLECWYPLLAELTPRSVCFRGRPSLDLVRAEFSWPVFVKGARQTSRHQRKLSFIENDAQFLSAMEIYAQDPILNWQDVVCREFVRLRSLPGGDEADPKMPRSFEFRTFWWKGELAGAGRYWWEGPAYLWNATEQAAGLAVAAEAAQRVTVPFLVIDIAQTQTGKWIVIECNDGQESGYAGVSPFALWQRIVDLEKGTATDWNDDDK